MKKEKINTDPKTERVRGMFNAIARKYDLLNRLISFGIDRAWRKELVFHLALHQPKRILDIAVGTADLAIDMVKAIPELEQVIGMDISEEMLQVGQQKVKNKGLEKKIILQEGNCEKLPFVGEFDALTCAFGVRNFEQLELSLQQMHKALREGGELAILELSIPRNAILRSGYMIWTKLFLPILGKLLSGNKEAYTYLPASIHRVPQYEAFIELLKNAGFSRLTYQTLSGGIATLYRGRK